MSFDDTHLHRGLELRILDAGGTRSLVLQTDHVPAVGSTMMVDGKAYLVQRSTVYVETRVTNARPHVVGCVANLAITHEHAARALDGLVPAFIGAVAGAEFVRRMRLQEEVDPVGRVPLLGRIVAGSPVQADEVVEGHLPVPLGWIRGGPHFALRVDGDSMRDAGILDGDVVIVRRQVAAGEGDVVAATIDGDTTLKTFRRRDGRSFLCPENPAYAPIDISDADTIIHGVVVGVMRQLTATRRGLKSSRTMAGRAGRRRPVQGSATEEGSATR